MYSTSPTSFIDYLVLSIVLFCGSAKSCEFSQEGSGFIEKLPYFAFFVGFHLIATINVQAQVVQKVDNAIHHLNNWVQESKFRA